MKLNYAIALAALSLSSLSFSSNYIETNEGIIYKEVGVVVEDNTVWAIGDHVNVFVNRSCSYGPGSISSLCECPANEKIISGGTFAPNGNALRENRKSGNGWRVACITPNGERIDCTDVLITCSQLHRLP